MKKTRFCHNKTQNSSENNEHQCTHKTRNQPVIIDNIQCVVRNYALANQRYGLNNSLAIQTKIDCTKRSFIRSLNNFISRSLTLQLLLRIAVSLLLELRSLYVRFVACLYDFIPLGAPPLSPFWSRIPFSFVLCKHNLLSRTQQTDIVLSQRKTLTPGGRRRIGVRAMVKAVFLNKNRPLHR